MTEVASLPERVTDSPIGAPTRPRAVLLVANAAAPYSRGLRVARSLIGAGWDVEIAAVAEPGRPGLERDGEVTIRRYPPRGMFRPLAHGRPPFGAGRGRLVARLGRWTSAAIKLVAWPAHVRAWWETLRAELPPADLYHAFGILAIPVALDLARSARSSGRHGAVVYDVIDVILESNNVERIPRPFLAWYRRRERRWAKRASAVVTVNDPIAEHLTRIWSLDGAPTVLLNCQPRWDPPSPRPDLIRATTGIPEERQIVLFLGRLGRDRGLEQAAEAVLALDDAAFVVLGFGPWADRLRERDAEPRFRGRHFTLPPVHPDDVPAWTASADASIIAVPARSLNQRLSTPNKFWESLTAGTPMVVGSGLGVMRAIVEEHRIGTTADPLDRDDLARALRAILDAPEVERAAMRERCLRAARDAYNWEMTVTPYLTLAEELRHQGR